MNKLYIFGTPGEVGGAATKIRDLVDLIIDHWEIVIVLSDIKHLKSTYVKRFCQKRKIPFITWNNFSSVNDGVGLAICERYFFSSGHADRVKKSGLKLVWSNDMMWEFPGEKEAARNGVIDRVVFVSQLQADAFKDIYNGLDYRIVPNYIDSISFPYSRPKNEYFIIGRLSRPDKDKYSENFPLFYESFDIDYCKFKVQAWSQELSKIYRWHKFDDRWILLKPNKEPARNFLSSLDLFVYPLGHRFVESWGRSVAESMLCGCVPVVPDGHQFHNMMIHEISGIIYKSYQECKDYVRSLASDYSLRERMGKNAAAFARNMLFNKEQHITMWNDVLSF